MTWPVNAPGSVFASLKRTTAQAGTTSELIKHHSTFPLPLDMEQRGTRPPQPLIMAFIDPNAQRGPRGRVDLPVLRELGCGVAARIYRVWRRGRPLAARTVSDAVLVGAISWPPEASGRAGPTRISGKPTTVPSTRRSNP